MAPQPATDRFLAILNHRTSLELPQYYDRREKFRIFHGSTNSTRPFAAEGARLIDISKMSHSHTSLNVDVEKWTALVEPNVHTHIPVDRLVEETLKYSIMAPAVMEFPTSRLEIVSMRSCGLLHAHCRSSFGYILLLLISIAFIFPICAFWCTALVVR
jgi:hypothetical protein